MTAALGRRLDLGSADRAVWAGWSGVALGVFAWWLTLPPLLVRTPAPSIVIALAAIGLGVWTVREGAARLGWGAVFAGVIGGVGAVASTESSTGNLEDVIVWSALAAAMLRYATPLQPAHTGRLALPRSTRRPSAAVM